MTSNPDESEDDRSSSPALTSTDTQCLLDLLLSHKKDHLQELFELPAVRTTGELRAWLQQAVADGRLNSAALLAALQRLEGWGDQRVTLFTAPASLSANWMDEGYVVSRLRKQGIERYLHAPPMVLTPQEPIELSSVDWAPDHLRMVWVSGVAREERMAERDLLQEDVVLRAFRLRVSRRLAAFDWNLVSGTCMLMMQRMPSTKDYARMHALVQQQLAPMISLDHLTRVRVNRAIRPIQRSSEVRCRQVSYLTARGDRLVYTSADRNHTVTVEPDEERGSGALAGLMGNFYWPASAHLPSTEVHFKVYRADQSVVFLGQYTEQDIRYVLSRIHRYSKTPS